MLVTPVFSASCITIDFASDVIFVHIYELMEQFAGNIHAGLTVEKIQQFCLVS